MLPKLRFKTSAFFICFCSNTSFFCFFWALYFQDNFFFLIHLFCLLGYARVVNCWIVSWPSKNLSFWMNIIILCNSIYPFADPIYCSNNHQKIVIQLIFLYLGQLFTSTCITQTRKDSRYTEKDAAVVVRQMLKVAAECHLHGLVHRDMKPEVSPNFTIRRFSFTIMP